MKINGFYICFHKSIFEGMRPLLPVPYYVYFNYPHINTISFSLGIAFNKWGFDLTIEKDK